MMIQSVLDNDLYKLTMMQAVLELYPDVEVEYEFTNRRKSNQFNSAFIAELNLQIGMMSALRLTDGEKKFLQEKCPYLNSGFIEHLSNYQYNPDEVSATLDEDNQLVLKIKGKWRSTIMWEVPLLALVSECYFKHVDRDWSYDGQQKKIHQKASLLSGTCQWADFSTRRRRDFQTQDSVILLMKNYDGFVGTSNVYLAMKHDVKPIGTMAHEWIMGHSVLKGLRHANKYALEQWANVFRGELGIALTDTYGSDVFFQDFDGNLARLFDGVRHDSGDPIAFAEKTIAHYKSLRIDPLSKWIVFSDGLNPQTAVDIAKWCKGKINCSFGIGTNFSNDFEGSPALNIVIKLRAVNGEFVVKLSDVLTKSTGDRDAVRVAKWMMYGTPLDSE